MLAQFSVLLTCQDVVLSVIALSLLKMNRGAQYCEYVLY